MRGHNDLCIVTYYRTPRPADAEYLTQLDASLSRMSNTINGHIIPAGKHI